MKRDLSKIFIDEIYFKPPKKNYPTNKTIVKHIDDCWSLDILDLIDYGPSNNKGYRYILTVIDNFSKFAWTIPLRNKNSETITNEFSNIIKSSKRKPNMIETDRGKEFYNNTFKNFLKLNNIHHYSRYTSKGAVFVEIFNRTLRNLLKKPVFEKGNASWINELPSTIKKYNNTIHHSTKMSPIEASKKSNEDEVFFNLRDKRKKKQPKYSIGNLVRTANKRNIFSKFDSTNWSYHLYKITEIINDTIPSYRLENYSERYNEALLQKSKLSLAENNKVMKKLNLS